MIISNSEFVVTLIRFLQCRSGYAAIFVSLGQYNLRTCDACSMQISQGAARSPVISREQRELARSTLCRALWLIPMLNIHKLYWPSEKQNGSVHAPENRRNITTNSEIYVYFTSGSILMVRKSEEY